MYRDEQNRWGSSGRAPQERPTFRPASWRGQRGSYPPPRNDTWRPRAGGSTPRRRRPARSPHHPYASSPSHSGPPPSPRPPTPTHHPYPDRHPHHAQRPMTSQRPATPQRHLPHVAPPMGPQRPATPRRHDAPHSAPLPAGGAATHYGAPPPYDHRNTRAPLAPAVAPPMPPPSSMPQPPPHFVNHRAPSPYTGAPQPPQRYVGGPQPTYAPLSTTPIQPPQAQRAPPRSSASPAHLQQQPMPPFAGAFRPATPPRIQVEWPHRPPALNVAAAVAAPPAPPQPQTPPAPPTPGGDAAFMAPGAAPVPAAAVAAFFPALRSKPLPQKAPAAAAPQSAAPPAQKTPAEAAAAEAPHRKHTQAIIDLEIGGSQSTVLLERYDDVFFVGVTQMDAVQRVLSFSPTTDRIEVLVGPHDTTTDAHMQCAKRIARALDARTDDVVLLSVAIADAEKSERWNEVTVAVERFASLRKQGKV